MTLWACLYVAQIRKPVGLDFQALKTRLVFNQGEPEKRITLQGRESESTLMTLAQPGCRSPYKVQVLVLQGQYSLLLLPTPVWVCISYVHVSTSCLLNFPPAPLLVYFGLSSACWRFSSSACSSRDRNTEQSYGKSECGG